MRISFIKTNSLFAILLPIIFLASNFTLIPAEAQENIDFGTPCKWMVGSCEGQTNWVQVLDESMCNYAKPGPYYNKCCCPYSHVNPDIKAKKEKPKFILPELQISIPGLTFTPTSTILKKWDEETGGYDVSIPWIGEYIKAVYNYSLSIAGILAALILMGGGILWLVSGGDASKITQAKELILGSVIGLVILMCSYILLIQINPALTKFQNINIKGISKNIFDTPDMDVSFSPLLTQENPFQDACVQAKKGDWSLCESYGEKIPDGLVMLEGKRVEKNTAAAYNQAVECVKEKNNGENPFQINSAFRSAQGQIDTKKHYIKLGKSEFAATPCCSNHGSGKAIDIKRKDGSQMSWAYNESSGLRECMNKYGLYAKLSSTPNEPWHFSPSGY